MLLAAQQERAGDVGRGAFAVEAHINLVAGEVGAGRKLEGVVARIRADIGEPDAEMKRVGRFPLQLDVVDGGLVADLDLGHGVALEAFQAKAAIALEHRGGSPLLGDDDVAGHHGCGLAGSVEMDEVDRLVERHALRNAERDAAGHQRHVEREHGVVLARVHLAQGLLQPLRRHLQDMGERRHVGARLAKCGHVRQIDAQLAFDEHKAIGGECGNRLAERRLKGSIVDGGAERRDQRVDLVEARAQIGIFPGLDAAMGQPETAIGLDGLLPQRGDERIVRAGERVGRPGIEVEEFLLGLGPELLDGKIHEPFPYAAVASPPYSA